MPSLVPLPARAAPLALAAVAVLSALVPALLPLVLGACAASGSSSPVGRVAPSAARTLDVPKPTEEQYAELQEAERLYVRRDPQFAAARDRLAQQPATALWLTRMLVRQALFALDHPRAGEDEVLRGAAGDTRDTPLGRLERARGEIVAIGAPAATCLVEDLLKHPHQDRNDLGVQLLAAIGPPALPALQAALGHEDVPLRRLAVRAVAGMPADPQVTAALERAARDANFTVRAAAVPGLATVPPDPAARLREVLQTDPDRYVRRIAAQTLGAPEFASAATSSALLAYYRECAASEDRRGLEAAEEALQKMSGERLRGLGAWQQWHERRFGTGAQPAAGRDRGAGAGGGRGG